MNLYELNQNWQEIFNMLEDSEIDDQTIFDTLESIECDINDKAENYGKIIRLLQGYNEMADKEIKRLQTLKKTCENREKILKKNLFSVMKNTGRANIDTGLFKYWIQKNPESVGIAADFNYEDMPEEYLIPQPSKVNKAKIKEDLKNGIKLEWAKLIQDESLRMR